jgi:hypothetical protein
MDEESDGPGARLDVSDTPGRGLYVVNDRRILDSAH